MNKFISISTQKHLKPLFNNIVSKIDSKIIPLRQEIFTRCSLQTCVTVPAYINTINQFMPPRCNKR